MARIIAASVKASGSGTPLLDASPDVRALRAAILWLGVSGSACKQHPSDNSETAEAAKNGSFSPQWLVVAVVVLDEVARGSSGVAEQTVRSFRDWLGSWLQSDVLDRWRPGRDTEPGRFHEALDQHGRPASGCCRLRVQARQIYVYAQAERLGWSVPSALLTQGLTVLRARFRRPDGLYRTRLEPDGEPADDTATVYDQAFVLLALAYVAKARPLLASDLEAEAVDLVASLRNSYADPSGGFADPAGPTPFQSDPQMHLLEAGLAWAAESQDPCWSMLIDAQAELGLGLLIDPASGVIKENYHQGWVPAPGAEGRLFEPGHQFEWAWLLERWGRLRRRSDACRAARSLFAVGERGVDRGLGSAVNGLFEDFTVAEPAARLWPQTERLKAAVILAEAEMDASQRDLYLGAAAEAGEAMRGYFECQTPGLWRDTLRPDGSFICEPSPASSLYHIVCAFLELRNRTAVSAVA